MVRKKAGLGERHKKILVFLSAFQQKNGYPPSIRQIGENIGVNSTSLVDYYLKQLQELGFIQREMHVSRSIRVLPTSTGEEISSRMVQMAKDVVTTVSEILSIPVLGRIVASAPIPMPQSDLAYFDPESSVELARSLLPAGEKVDDLFALEVSGDSMVDAMVNDGDLVIMRKTQTAHNGEMVAVWLDDENTTTLKYFYRENNRVRLQPANPTMGPIFVDNPRIVRIMGSVVMIIRQVKSLAA